MKTSFGNFNFPFFKQAGFFGLAMIFLPPLIETESYTIKSISLFFFVVSAIYFLLGKYQSLSSLDELQRLIELEKGYLLSQFGLLGIFVFYLIHSFFKVDTGFSTVIIAIVVLGTQIKKYLNKKFE